MPTHTIQHFLISLPFSPAVNGSRQKCCMDGLRLALRWLSSELPSNMDSGTTALWYNTTSQLYGPTGRRCGWREGKRGKTLHGCNSKSWRTPRSFQQDFNPIKANQNKLNSTTESTADNVLVTQLSTISSPVEDSVCCIKRGRKYRINPSTKGGLRREWWVMLLIYINVGFLAGFSAGFRSFLLCKWELKCRTCSMPPARTITFLKQGFNWRS